MRKTLPAREPKTKPPKTVINRGERKIVEPKLNAQQIGKRTASEPKLNAQQIEAVANYLSWYCDLPPKLAAVATWRNEMKQFMR